MRITKALISPPIIFAFALLLSWVNFSMGNTLYLGGMFSNDILIFDDNTLQVVTQIAFDKKGTLYRIIFSRDGNRAYVHTLISNIGVIDTNKNQLIGELRVAERDENVEKDLRVLGILPNSDVIHVKVLKITAFDDRGLLKEWTSQLRTISLKTGELIGKVSWPENIVEIGLSPGRKGVLAFIGKIYLGLIDINSGLVAREFAVPIPPGWTSITVIPISTVSPKGRIFMLLNGVKEEKGVWGVGVFDPAEEKINSFEIKGTVPFFKAIAVSPDEKFLYTTFNDVARIDLEAREVREVKRLERTEQLIFVSLDGKRLFLPFLEDILVLDSTTLKEIARVDLTNRFTVSIAAQKPVSSTDMNEDGVTNIIDVLSLIDAIRGVGKIQNPNGGDINGDGKVNIEDLRLLVESIA